MSPVVESVLLAAHQGDDRMEGSFPDRPVSAWSPATITSPGNSRRRPCSCQCRREANRHGIADLPEALLPVAVETRMLSSSSNTTARVNSRFSSMRNPWPAVGTASMRTGLIESMPLFSVAAAMGCSMVAIARFFSPLPSDALRGVVGGLTLVILALAQPTLDTTNGLGTRSRFRWR